MQDPVNFIDANGKNPLVAAAFVVWGVLEIGSSVYDLYEMARVDQDKCASLSDKSWAGGAFVAGTVLPGSGSAYTSVARKLSPSHLSKLLASASRGRQMHKVYKVAEHAAKIGRKEFPVKGGKIDFLDTTNHIIYELKPNNPAAIALGYRQARRYLKALQGVHRLNHVP